MTTQPREFAPDEAKFRELLLYVCLKSQDDPTFGAVKLNKLLWQADRLAYGFLERPITGVAYVKRRLGPAPLRLVQVRTQMIAEGLLAAEVRPYGSYPQKRLVPLRRPDLSAFSADEIALVDGVIDEFRAYDATQIADWSHEFYACAAAEEEEIIPYETVFLSRRRLNPGEAQHLCDIARERHWNVF